MRAFIIALILFAALVAAVLIGSRPAMGQALEAAQHVQNSVSHYVREAEVAQAKKRMADLSVSEIAAIGAAARMAADGDEVAQLWLDAQMAKLCRGACPVSK